MIDTFLGKTVISRDNRKLRRIDTLIKMSGIQ